MDKEEVAFLFRQRDLTTAPGVDKSGRLIGQNTIDDVVDVIDEEAGEDFLKLAGVRATEESSIYRTIIATARSRFLWLFLNLGTAFAASTVIGVFEGSIAKLSALAILMPICASMGGNAGTQTLAMVVRSLATRELHTSNAFRVAWKELFIGLINGLLFAVITGVLAYFWFDDRRLGMVIGAAMVVNLRGGRCDRYRGAVGLGKIGRRPCGFGHGICHHCHECGGVLHISRPGDLDIALRASLFSVISR